MSLRRSSQDKRCPICLVHQDNCYCEQTKSLDLKTRVGIIMFKKERWLPSNTAQLAHRCLTNSEIFLRGLPDTPVTENFIHSHNYTPLYLYPDEDAIELTPDYISTLNSPIQLIVPDGTWRQAKKIHVREKTLSSIQKVKLQGLPSSIYSLRRQKFDEGVCTHEAIAYALGIIEGKEVEKHLIAQLKIMLKAHLQNRPVFEKQKKHKGRTVLK